MTGNAQQRVHVATGKDGTHVAGIRVPAPVVAEVDQLVATGRVPLAACRDSVGLAEILLKPGTQVSVVGVGSAAFKKSATKKELLTGTPEVTPEGTLPVSKLMAFQLFQGNLKTAK